MVVDAEDADVLGDEPIWHDGKVVGWVTSGGYAHWADKSLAMGYVPRELARIAASRSRSSAAGEPPGRSGRRYIDPQARACAAELRHQSSGAPPSPVRATNASSASRISSQ